VTTFLLTLAAFGTVILAMAVGVMFTGRRLQGSCGGTGTNCSCSADKQRECKTKGKPTPHAETPIEASTLARR